MDWWLALEDLSFFFLKINFFSNKYQWWWSIHWHFNKIKTFHQTKILAAIFPCKRLSPTDGEQFLNGSFIRLATFVLVIQFNWIVCSLWIHNVEVVLISDTFQCVIYHSFIHLPRYDIFKWMNVSSIRIVVYKWIWRNFATTKKNDIPFPPTKWTKLERKKKLSK